MEDFFNSDYFQAKFTQIDNLMFDMRLIWRYAMNI